MFLILAKRTVDDTESGIELALFASCSGTGIVGTLIALCPVVSAGKLVLGTRIFCCVVAEKIAADRLTETSHHEYREIESFILEGVVKTENPVGILMAKNLTVIVAIGVYTTVAIFINSFNLEETGPNTKFLHEFRIIVCTPDTGIFPAVDGLDGVSFKRFSLMRSPPGSDLIFSLLHVAVKVVDQLEILGHDVAAVNRQFDTVVFGFARFCQLERVSPSL